jgi:glycosyltransferase involved in cell wall biosynthesis
MEVRRDLVDQPYFSICVPQYNRTSFLIEACRSLAAQTFRRFEICISDDCSTDGREDQLLSFLNGAGLSFVYRKQEKNTRYDGNLRASIALARGEYCFLLGNDDSLATPSVLDNLYAEMQRQGSPAVVITNYEDFDTGNQHRRFRQTGIVGSGPRAASSCYREFSFVSGVVLHRQKAVAHTTTKWDGSEMYQMYLGSRMIAEGGALLAVDTICIRQGIRIPGEAADSYARRPKLDPCPIVERPLPLGRMGAVVADAIVPYVDLAARDQMVQRIFLQILFFTYPFWIIEYKRVQSWNYSAGICMGMKPSRLLDQVEISAISRLRLSLIYALVTIAGLLTPLWLFDYLHPKLYAFAKSAYKK